MRKNLSRGGILLGVFVILLSVFTSVFGQEFRGTIVGNVTDQNGAVIVGATVIVKNTETNISQTVITNSDGAFTVPFLLPGKYSISATNEGFKTSTVDNIDLKVDDRLTIDIKLEIGLTTEVNVIADN